MHLDANDLDVIYAEDEMLFRELAVPGLERLGIPEENICVAENGNEALEHLKELQGGEPRRPLVMMLDIRMPGMDGTQCAKHVREQFSSLRRKPMLASFSAGFGDDETSSLFDVSLPKSFGPKEMDIFLDKVKHWWEQTGSRQAEASAPSGPPRSAAPAAATAARAAMAASVGIDPGDPKSVDIIVADDKPIYKMTICQWLNKLGVEEDNIIEVDGPEDLLGPLSNPSRESAGKPIIVFLGTPEWLRVVKAASKQGRRAFIVSTTNDPNDVETAEWRSFVEQCDADLRPAWNHEHLKEVFDKMSAWWVRQ